VADATGCASTARLRAILRTLFGRLARLADVISRVDQSEMREGLREIPDESLCTRIVFNEARTSGAVRVPWASGASLLHFRKYSVDWRRQSSERMPAVRSR
jgi:hypothetical protein